MEDEELHRRSARDIAEAVRAGRLRARLVVEAVEAVERARPWPDTAPDVPVGQEVH